MRRPNSRQAGHRPKNGMKERVMAATRCTDCGRCTRRAGHISKSLPDNRALGRRGASPSRLDQTDEPHTARRRDRWSHGLRGFARRQTKKLPPSVRTTKSCRRRR
jgi:hypothetical protein